MEVSEILAIIERLAPKTRRRMARVKWRLGKKYVYKPRADLLRRISEEFSCSRDEAFSKIMAVREFILKNSQYY